MNPTLVYPATVMAIPRRKFLKASAQFVGLALSARAALGSGQVFGIEGDAAVYRNYRDRIRNLFEKKRPPGPGDWLDQHKEVGQSFEQYSASQPTRATATRKTIEILLLGEFPKAQEKSLELLREYMGLLYGLPVRMGKPLPLSIVPGEARREHPVTRDKQLLTSHLLHRVLKPRLANDAVAMLALTNADLWPGMGWNFVFGQASIRDRVGVWSTARFGDPVQEEQRFLRRVLHVGTHETGHIFGIRHCTAHECCMNGANSLDEADRAPLNFCAECDAKLCWAANLATRPRAEKLAAFMEKIAFAREAALWKSVLERL